MHGHPSKALREHVVLSQNGSHGPGRNQRSQDPQIGDAVNVKGKTSRRDREKTRRKDRQDPAFL